MADKKDSKTDGKNKLIKVFSTLMSRLNFANKLGYSYEGERDIYAALGYSKDLTYKDYRAQYARQDIAQAIIKRPVQVTWRGRLLLTEPGNDKETTLEKEWNTLEKELKLKSKFSRLDKLTGLGRYGVLFLGFDDVKEHLDFAEPVKEGARKLLYVKPLGESSAVIKTYDDDASSKRFGKPMLYEIKTVDEQGGKEHVILVHHTRVIHTVDDPLESEIESAPRLEVVFNRLKDLEKLIGGSAEMFWRGARPGFAGNVKEDYELGSKAKDDLFDQMDDYDHDLRRLIMAEGIDLKTLAMQIADPKNHVDIQIQMISTVTTIPKRILTGTERSELASSQDRDEWFAYVTSRREEFAEPTIIEPFVERMMEYGVLTKTETDKWAVMWEDLFAASEKDRVEIGKNRAEALKHYTTNAAAEYIVPSKAFFEFFLGLNEEQTKMIEEMRAAAVSEDTALDQITDLLEEDTEPKKKEIITEE